MCKFNDYFLTNNLLYTFFLTKFLLFLFELTQELFSSMLFCMGNNKLSLKPYNHGDFIFK